MIKNKKGDNPTSINGLIIALIFIALTLLIGFVIFQGMKDPSKSFMANLKDAFTFSGGGNVPDLINPCKCGWPTSEDYEEIEHEGTKYCVKSKNECGPNEQIPLYKTIEYRRIAGQDPVKLCVYTKSECADSKK